MLHELYFVPSECSMVANKPMPHWANKTFKTRQTSSPQYLSQHISLRTSARNTRSSSVPLLRVPFRRISFARRSFSTATPLTWNSLPPAVLNCDSLLSNPDLKLICFLLLSANYSTYLFRQRLCSRLAALWRFINFVLLLLVLVLLVYKWIQTSSNDHNVAVGLCRACSATDRQRFHIIIHSRLFPFTPTVANGAVWLYIGLWLIWHICAFPKNVMQTNTLK